MLWHAQASEAREPPEGTSSTGRASVSKTEGWGFKSLVPCKNQISTSSSNQSNEGEWRVGQQGRPRSAREAARGRTSIPTFYRQVVAELRKVVWPTQEQLVTYFIVVMVFVLLMMALVSALDLGFGKLAFEVFSGRRLE